MPASDGPPPLAASRVRILLIDESDFSREFTRVTLERHGFEVVELPSALGMNAEAAGERPDLVLMDVDLPALQGDEALTIARRYVLQRCPVLLYSGLPPSELEVLARACGADGFVSKTAGADTLIRMVRRLLP